MTDSRSSNQRRYFVCSSLLAIALFCGYKQLNKKKTNTNNNNNDNNNDKRIENKSKRPKVGLGCLILRKNKNNNNELEFLIGTRKSSHGAGMYQLPGGHLEHGETWQYCAHKEVLEETNLNIQPKKWKFVFINNSMAPGKQNKNEKLHYIDIIMATMYDGNDEPINAEPNKCEGWQWLSWNNHNLEKNKMFCGLYAILNSKDFDPTNDFEKYISYDQWEHDEP